VVLNFVSNSSYSTFVVAALVPKSSIITATSVVMVSALLRMTV